METFSDKHIPSIKLYKLKDGTGQEYFSIDTYEPDLSDLDDAGKMVAYESALGWRLRLPTNTDECLFVSPKRVEINAIRRLLDEYSSAIQDTGMPLVVGCIYDAYPPGETSHKHTIELFKDFSDDFQMVLSTAYTVPSDFRKISGDSEGRIAVEIRVPGILGVNNPPASQIGWISRRLDFYGNRTPWLLKFGPLVEMPNQDLNVNIEKFWEKIGSTGHRYNTNQFIGQRLLCLDAAMVPDEYINLVKKCAPKHSICLSTNYSFTGHKYSHIVDYVTRILFEANSRVDILTNSRKESSIATFKPNTRLKNVQNEVNVNFRKPHYYDTLPTKTSIIAEDNSYTVSTEEIND